MKKILHKPVSTTFVEYLTVARPITVQDVKNHARIEYDSEDALIQIYIDAAIERCELEIQQKIVRQRVKVNFEGFGGLFTGLLLDGLGKHASVELVQFYDRSEALQTTTDYRVVDAAQKYILPNGSALLNRWPDMSLNNHQVVVTATAGFADVPNAIKQWLLVMSASSFMAREGMGDKQMYDVGFIDRLLDPYRTLVI